MFDKALFYFFASLAVVSAFLVVTRRNAVHSAIFLITALLATAGIFLQLHAEFLFIVQIILYVGGIMVLFVFVIMLVNLDVAAHQPQFNGQTWVASLDRKSTRLNSRHVPISYAGFCLKKKKNVRNA